MNVCVLKGSARLRVLEWGVNSVGPTVNRWVWADRAAAEQECNQLVGGPDGRGGLDCFFFSPSFLLSLSPSPFL